MLTEIQKACFEAVAMEMSDRIDFREDYSGRGMYGTKTIGVVGNTNDLFEFAQALGAKLSEEGEKMIENLTTDDMGKQKILYVHQ